LLSVGAAETKRGKEIDEATNHFGDFNNPGDSCRLKRWEGCIKPLHSCRLNFTGADGKEGKRMKFKTHIRQIAHRGDSESIATFYAGVSAIALAVGIAVVMWLVGF
jgi:hypothetical protein